MIRVRNFLEMAGTLRAAPSSSNRGEVRVQPAYYTSSLFVDPLREDINALVDAYVKEYNQAKEEPEVKPFGIFKDVWRRLGWSLLHLKVLDPRGRETFLNVVLRLFIGTFFLFEADCNFEADVVCLIIS